MYIKELDRANQAETALEEEGSAKKKLETTVKGMQAAAHCAAEQLQASFINPILVTHRWEGLRIVPAQLDTL